MVGLWGHEVLHRFPLGDLRTDVGGGEVEHGHGHHGDLGMAGQGAALRAGTGVNIEFVAADDGLPVFPPCEVGQVVGPHKDAELCVGVPLA